MSDTNGQDDLQKASSEVVTTLLGKRDKLLEERAKLRNLRTMIATRDREIDRELADCQAAGRVFGIEVELPKDEPDWPRLRPLWPEEPLLQPDAPVAASTPPAEQAASGAARAAATKAEMPRVSDIVLDRLREAGEAGSKATAIQGYVENTYQRKLHDKTVGTALYRLQREGRVRRDGHTWFIVPETVNPGGDTPALKDLLK